LNLNISLKIFKYKESLDKRTDSSALAIKINRFVTFTCEDIACVSGFARTAVSLRCVGANAQSLMTIDGAKSTVIFHSNGSATTFSNYVSEGTAYAKIKSKPVLAIVDVLRQSTPSPR